MAGMPALLANISLPSGLMSFSRSECPAFAIHCVSVAAFQQHFSLVRPESSRQIARPLQLAQPQQSSIYYA